MAIRGLKELKNNQAKNDAEVEQNENIVKITFDNPIKVDGTDVKEFELEVPTLENVEMASAGLSDPNNITATNHLLSNLMTPSIAPDDFKEVFTLKEHSILSEVLGTFL